MIFKSRLKQYFKLLLVILIVGTIIYPIYDVNASYYKMDGENSSETTITEGMYLDTSDHIEITSNLHTALYICPDGIAADDYAHYTKVSWTMSGQTLDISQPATNKIWKITKISNVDFYMQQVDKVSSTSISDQTVAPGNTATFDGTTTIKGSNYIYYKWYKVVGEKDNGTENNDILMSSTDSSLVIEPNSEYYQDGSKFYYRAYDYGSLDYYSDVVTLNIKIPYSLTYKSVDGTETYKTEINKYVENEKVSLDYSIVPKNNNYVFLGWSKSANSEVAEYKKDIDKLTMGNNNMTIYAVWGKSIIKDEKTEIEAQGIFTYKAKLSIEKIRNEENPFITIEDKNEEILGTYNVKIENGNYDGKINLNFSVGNEYNGKEVTIYHKLSTGKIEEKTAVVKDGIASITVDELSPFMITINKSISNPKTFDNIDYLLICFGISTIGIIGSTILFNKNKKEN